MSVRYDARDIQINSILCFTNSSMTNLSTHTSEKFSTSKCEVFWPLLPNSEIGFHKQKKGKEEEETEIIWNPPSSVSTSFLSTLSQKVENKKWKGRGRGKKIFPELGLFLLLFFLL